MKVVHISGTAYGGAGRAAWRLHEAMLAEGMDSIFCSIDEWTEKDAATKHVYRLNNPLPRGFAERLIYKWRNSFVHRDRKQEEQKLNDAFSKERNGWQCETAALPFGYKDLYLIPEFRAADAIILHSVNSVLDLRRFFEDFKHKPVIWTLHDMNPFQGLFHYREDQERNSPASGPLNSQIVQIKQEAYRRKKNRMVVAAPSRWLAAEAAGSELLGGYRNVCIPYSLDLTVFRPKDKSSVRQRLNLGEHDKVLLFIADNVRNIRKGFDLLLEALQQLHTAQIVLLALGDDQGKALHTGSVRYAGRVNDDELMADYFNAADAFVLPSREDNLPNVMLEAFACGCPVIGFPVGGIQEHVIAGKTGVLANEVSGPALATAIDNFFTTYQSFSRADIRTYAEENFNRKVQVAAYRSVIEEMMN